MPLATRVRSGEAGAPRNPKGSRRRRTTGRVLALRPMIGVYASGVGELSVLRELRRLLPEADLVYLADQANAPYGERTIAEVRRFAEAAVGILIERGATTVVVACNTASAAALGHLRSVFSVPIVGMEPAVKPAAGATRTGRGAGPAPTVALPGA